MATLVLGASGATGKMLVEQLLSKSQKVKAIVRRSANIPQSWISSPDVTLIYADINSISCDDMTEYMTGCTAVASCLGHNINIKGIFGKPKRLVADAVRLVFETVQKNKSNQSIKFILLNTVANQNRDLNENVPTSQKVIISIIRLLLAPQADNEEAADYLRLNVGNKNPNLAWVIVRPDTLIDAELSEYEIIPSPSRSMFKPAKSSRINVANFMANLISDSSLFDKWQGQMPVIYNIE